MRIATGFDHAGYPLKHVVVAALEDAGHGVIDCRDRLRGSVDYPIHAAEAAGGTPALTTRGMVEDDMREIGDVVCHALAAAYDDSRRAELSERTRALTERHPLYADLAATV